MESEHVAVNKVIKTGVVCDCFDIDTWDLLTLAGICNLQITEEEEEERTVLLNVKRATHLPKCMTSHPRKPKKGCSSPSELCISYRYYSLVQLAKIT
jgi:hypothetical protein